MASAVTYESVNLENWKLGNMTTSSKGLKKVEIVLDDGFTNPMLQLWKPDDPFLRAPYGISEPFGSNEPGGQTVPNIQQKVKSLPLELKHPPHLAFMSRLDQCVLDLIFKNQATLFSLKDDEDKLPISMLRRQYCGVVKPSKNPVYPPTCRTKINLGSGNDSTEIRKLLSGGRLERCSSDNIIRGCLVLPIITVSGIWLSSTGGFGLSVSCASLLVVSSGVIPRPLFTGIDNITPVAMDEESVSKETSNELY